MPAHAGGARRAPRNAHAPGGDAGVNARDAHGRVGMGGGPAEQVEGERQQRVAREDCGLARERLPAIDDHIAEHLRHLHPVNPAAGFLAGYMLGA